MTTPAEKIDSVKIVEEIREEVTRRREAGDLTPEDVELLLESRLKESIAKARIDEKVAARLLRESQDWNIDTDYEIRTGRPGPEGVAIRFAKAVVRPFVRLYTDHILKRQGQLNLALWYVLRDSVRHGAALEMEVRRLRKEVQDLKDRR